MKYENIVEKLIPHPPIFISSEDKYPYYARATTRIGKDNHPEVTIILCKTSQKANVYVKRMKKFNSLIGDLYFSYITTGLTENLNIPTVKFYAKYDSSYEDDSWKRLFKPTKYSHKR